ncbi:MAG: hypothetical protein GY796_12580, partial [Chloroflexi bacterium]|nr:hypothetical protein [Chloroflexota bacterium]
MQHHHILRNIIFFVILSGLIVPFSSQSFTVTQSVQAQELPGESLTEETVKTGGQPQMEFQPSRTAATISEFAPTNVVQESLTADPGQMAVTKLPPNEDRLVNVNNGRVAIAVEPDTITETATLEFTAIDVPAPSLTATNTISDPVDTLTLMKFTIELREQDSGQIIGEFAKPIRLVVDLRDLTPGLNPVYSDYFLAYEDETTPGIWHEVPVNLHQPGGLMSAEVTHFSKWATGVRPERWNPSWTPPAVSAFSGAATYNYPIEVPPGRNGLQPPISLSYNSRALDGRIHNGKSGPIADGWSLGEISIVRVGVKLENPSPQEAYSLHPDKFRLVFNGVGHEIYPDDSANTTNDATVRYYAKDAPGFFIERNYNAATPNTDGIFWIVITSDGTRYRLGYTADAEEWQQVTDSPHLKIKGHKGNSHSGEYYSAIAWHVDTVTDSFGNQMTYHYHTRKITEDIQYLNGSSWDDFDLDTQKSRVNSIRYNYPQTIVDIGESLPARDDVPQLTATISLTPTHIEFRPDTITYHSDKFRINSIFIYHGNSPEPISEYRITTQRKRADSPGCKNFEVPPPYEPRESSTRVVSSIQQFVGTDDDATTFDDGYTLPAVTFYYGDDLTDPGDFDNPLPHFYKDGSPCFQFFYLHGYDNGYGGQMQFTYEHDGRSEGIYKRHDNGVTYWYEWPKFGYNYFVTEVRSNDGLNGDTLTTYDYTEPCYGQWSSEYGDNNNFANPKKCKPPDAPKYGNITGFKTAVQTNFNYDGTTVLNRQDTIFSHNTATYIGRPLSIDLFDENGVQLTRVENDYGSTVYANAGGDTKDDVYFTYTDWTKNLQYDGSTYMGTKVQNLYETTYQGGQQWGKLTRQHFFWVDSDGNEIFHKYEITKYLTSATEWRIVPWVSGTWKWGTPEWIPLNVTQFLYDDNTNNPDTQTITDGILTLSRSLLVDNPQIVSGNTLYDSVDTAYGYDDFGNQTTVTTYSQYGTAGHNGTIWNQSALATGPRTTNIAYDTGYNLYPVSVSNPANQVTTFEIYGFDGVPLQQYEKGDQTFTIQPGLLQSVTEANQLTTVYEYDPHGRLYQLYVPGDDRGVVADLTDGDPVTRYRYWDNTWNSSTRFLEPDNNPPAPFLIATRQRPNTWLQPGNSNGGFAYNDQTFYDGFG